jgi:hypothetical protein
VKRAIAILVAATAAGTAFAEPTRPAAAPNGGAVPSSDPLDRMLASTEAVRAALAPEVTVGPIAWADPACVTRFGAAAAASITVSGEARDDLAGCIAGLHLTRAKLDVGSPGAAIGTSGAVVALGLRRGKLAALDAVAVSAKEPRSPTVLRLWVNRDFVPGAATRAAIARTPKHRADATFKICHDDQGAITSRRIIRGSAVAAFDVEAFAYFATVDQLAPYQPGGRPAPACSILALRYPDVLGGS